MKRPLRIFLSCQQSVVQHAVPAYRFWAEYFRAACAEAGHVLIEEPSCDWAEGLLPLPPDARRHWLERTWSAALRRIEKELDHGGVDFFLGYLFPAQVTEEALAGLRSRSVPTVNFFCDNVREFRSVPPAFRSFDLHWVPEHAALTLYRSAKLPHLSAPMACWVPPACRTPVQRETLPVTFVGTRDEQREVLFADAIDCGLRLELRGVGWDGSAPSTFVPRPAVDWCERIRRQWEFGRQHGWAALIRKLSSRRRPLEFDFAAYTRPAPVGDDYWRVLRESAVCLGVNRFPSLRFPFDRPGTYSRLRDIEAPMAGACYLTEWTEGLDSLYEPGREIATYRTPAELAHISRELMADPARRAQLRIAGQRRALAEHGIASTLSKIAQHLGL